MKSTANTLLIVGGGIVLAPLAYMYLCNRLIAQTLVAIAQHSPGNDANVNFKPGLPEYYVPICLLIGATCIGVGILLARRSRDAQGDFQPHELDDRRDPASLRIS